MIKELTMVAEGDDFIEYKTDKGDGKILFSAIKPYWDHADGDEFERGFADVIDDNHILAVILVASEQGGILVVWNAETQTIEHVSQAAFCQAATVYDGDVYTLSYVHQWGVTPFVIIEKCKYGIMDASAECETVIKTSADYFLDNYRGNFDDLNLEMDDKGIRVFLKDVEVPLN